MKSFTDTVKQIVKKIPKGEVRTYRQVAIEAGRPSAHRAVANAMASNYDDSVPCHRVIRTDGNLGGYNRGGEGAKRKLLQSEGAIL